MTAKDQSNPVGFSEADTCREYVTPAIQAAGWGDTPFEIAEQRFFTDGRIVLTGRTAKRREGKRADYLLRYRRDHTVGYVIRCNKTLLQHRRMLPLFTSRVRRELNQK